MLAQADTFMICCVTVCRMQLAARQAVLPPDASCEDIEIDPHLPFLTAFVQAALQSGAAPYIPGVRPSCTSCHVSACWAECRGSQAAPPDFLSRQLYAASKQSKSLATCCTAACACHDVACCKSAASFCTAMPWAEDSTCGASAAEDRQSLGVVRASTHGEHAAMAKPINFKAYERPTLPASRPPAPLMAAGPQPAMVPGASPALHGPAS